MTLYIRPREYAVAQYLKRAEDLGTARIWTITKDETRAFISRLAECVESEEKSDNSI